MKIFGKVRPSKTPAAPLGVPTTTSNREVMDKYGMINFNDEEDLPEPALGEELVPVPPSTPKRKNVPTENERSDDEGKKKKKKKKKKRKKKRGNAVSNDDEDLIVVNRVPTAMEYESDDSIEKMIDEKSRYSRYTTDHDEIDVEKFDDGPEESTNIDDKYAGNAAKYPITSVLSDESNPAKWPSFDEEEQNKVQSAAARINRSGSAAGKSGRKKTKKYQDLREFQKRRSLPNEPADAYPQFQLPDFSALLPGSFSPTKQPKSSQAIPHSESDTSSLTDPMKKREKYVARLMEQRESKSRGKGPPREISATQARQAEEDGFIISMNSSGSSENLHHNYKTEQGNNTRVIGLADELDHYMAEIAASGSGSRLNKSRDRYAEADVQQEAMYATSLMNEEDSMYTEDSPKPLGRSERTKRAQMKELDEYSVAMSVQDEPAIVQCMKFYHCGAAAALAGFGSTRWLTTTTDNGVAKEVKMLGRGPELDEIDKMRYREYGDLPSDVGVGQRKSMSSKGDRVRSKSMISNTEYNMLDQDDAENSFLRMASRSEDVTVDAPDIKAPEKGASSYLREVTSLSLRLDDDGAEKKKKKKSAQENSGWSRSRDSDADLRIAEISVPLSPTKKAKKQKRKKKEQSQDRSQKTVLGESQNTEQRRVLDAQSTTRKAGTSRRDAASTKTDKYSASSDMQIISKKSSGSSEESARPSKSKKGLLSRFGRKVKRQNSKTSAEF